MRFTRTKNNKLLLVTLSYNLIVQFTTRFYMTKKYSSAFLFNRQEDNLRNEQSLFILLVARDAGDVFLAPDIPFDGFVSRRIDISRSTTSIF